MERYLHLEKLSRISRSLQNTVFEAMFSELFEKEREIDSSFFFQ